MNKMIDIMNKMIDIMNKMIGFRLPQPYTRLPRKDETTVRNVYRMFSYFYDFLHQVPSLNNPIKGVTGNVWWLNWICSLLYNFYFIFLRFYLIIKKTILKMYPPKFMILNVDLILKLSNHTSWKRFICLKWILKNLSTLLHTLPVTSFKRRYLR